MHASARKAVDIALDFIFPHPTRLAVVYIGSVVRPQRQEHSPFSVAFDQVKSVFSLMYFQYGQARTNKKNTHPGVCLYLCVLAGKDS